MKIVQAHESTDQADCIALLTELGILEAFKPVPPRTVCDCRMQINDNAWLVGTNDAGTYTLVILIGADQSDAIVYQTALMKKANCGRTNHRAIAVLPESNPSVN